MVAAEPHSRPADPGRALALPASGFSRASASLPLLPQLFPVRGGSHSHAWGALRRMAGDPAAIALPPLRGGRARPRPAARAQGFEGRMKESPNQRLFLAIAIWLACFLAL